MRMIPVVALLSIAGVVVPLLPQDEQARTLQRALGDDLVGGRWIYEDIEAGYARAKETGRPLLVSFRCVP